MHMHTRRSLGSEYSYPVRNISGIWQYWQDRGATILVGDGLVSACYEDEFGQIQRELLTDVVE